jgi:hypothetical protein
MPITINLPDDPATLDLAGDPRDLPGPLYEQILDVYAAQVSASREPLAAVLATARMVTEAARVRRWPIAPAARLGDIAAKLCQTVCDDALRMVD